MFDKNLTNDELNVLMKKSRELENLKRFKLICPHHHIELEQNGKAWDCSDKGITQNFTCPECEYSVNVHIVERSNNEQRYNVRSNIEECESFIGEVTPLVLVH